MDGGKRMISCIRIDGIPMPVLQVGNDTVLRAALREGVGFPYECNSGGCGSCRFELLGGEVHSLWPEAPGLSDRDRRRKQLLGCQSRALGDIAIKVRCSPEFVSAHRPRRQRARLMSSVDLTHDIREFRFATESPAEFSPGQYASVALGESGVVRSYSMSNLPNIDGQWHFQIRCVPGGAATGWLFGQSRIGDEVEIDGPYGLASLREHVRRDIVCVAGGSGLAPMVSVARGASAAGMLETGRLHFFYGAREPRDVCGDDLLRQLPQYQKAIRYCAVVSGAQRDRSAWSGETGYVHDAVARHLGADLDRYEFYFAGPPPMTEALQEMLMLQFRVPNRQLHFDRFY